MLSRRRVSHIPHLAAPQHEGLRAIDRSKLVGPQDLAWLLERVADFGSEEPTWREGIHLPPWNSEQPPPPLQLLIPETVLFDSDARPKATFFTDSGGFVRGLRKTAIKEPHNVYDSIVKIYRSRQQLERERQEERDAAISSVPSKQLFEEHDSQLTAVPGTPSSPSKAKRSSYSSCENFGFGGRTRRNDWRMVLLDGSTLPLSELEVANCFEAPHHWPMGSHFLQVGFWFGKPNEAGTDAELSYHYDALQSEAHGSKHDGLAAIHTNHFERHCFLERVRDRNRMSALPLLLSQHTAYYCGLDLVSCTLHLAKDGFGQLWLADVSGLFFLPKQRPSGGQEVPQKFFRYSSEEALLALPVSEQHGQKCQLMMGKMTEHYTAMKHELQISTLFHADQAETIISVPIFEGTDMKALASTFGLENSAACRSGKDWRQRRFPNTPQKQGIVCRGRLVTTEGAASIRTPRRSGASAGKWMALRPLHLSPPREGQQAENQESASSSEQHCGSSRFQLVWTAEAAALMPGSGPGLRPEGLTLDMIGPKSAREVGNGLQQRKALPPPTIARVVVVPHGAAAALKKLASRPGTKNRAADREK